MELIGWSAEVEDEAADSKGDGASELGELVQEEESGSGSVWVETVDVVVEVEVEVSCSVWVWTEQVLGIGSGSVYVARDLVLGAWDGGRGARRGGKSRWGWRGTGTRFQLGIGLSGG